MSASGPLMFKEPSAFMLPWLSMVSSFTGNGLFNEKSFTFRSRSESVVSTTFPPGAAWSVNMTFPSLMLMFETAMARLPSAFSVFSAGAGDGAGLFLSETFSAAWATATSPVSAVLPLP